MPFVLSASFLSSGAIISLALIEVVPFVYLYRYRPEISRPVLFLSATLTLGIFIYWTVALWPMREIVGVGLAASRDAISALNRKLLTHYLAATVLSMTLEYLTCRAARSFLGRSLYTQNHGL